MYYDKRIRYLSYYESGIKLQNAGYVKFQVRDSLCQMVIYMKGPRLMGSGEARVYLLSEKPGRKDEDDFYQDSRKNNLQKHLLGNLSIRNGQGHCAVRMNAENMADSGLRYDEICGLKIELHEYQYLESRWIVTNFMPGRKRMPDNREVGYRLCQPQNGDSSVGRRMQGGIDRSEEEPVKVDLIVTPVSENLRVEKLVRKEQVEEQGETAKEIVIEELQNEDFAQAIPEQTESGEMIIEMPEGNSAEESIKEPTKEMRGKEEFSEGVPRREAPEELAREILNNEETSMQEMLEREVRKEEAKSEQSKEPEQTLEEEILQGMEMAETPKIQGMAEEIPFSEQELQPDKWEQLKKTYPVVHPIREEEEYLKITPKDFVVFTEKYQQLVHNSFLLHGYYNYKHLILGKKEKNGKMVYYLGVPGTFHEREKRVAVMFGFEAFDGKREPAENGDFGYYLKRVEI